MSKGGTAWNRKHGRLNWRYNVRTGGWPNAPVRVPRSVVLGALVLIVTGALILALSGCKAIDGAAPVKDTHTHSTTLEPHTYNGAKCESVPPVDGDWCTRKAFTGAYAGCEIIESEASVTLSCDPDQHWTGPLNDGGKVKLSGRNHTGCFIRPLSGHRHAYVCWDDGNVFRYTKAS